MPDNEQTVTDSTESEPMATLDAFNAAYEADTDQPDETEESDAETAEGGESEDETEEEGEVEAESSEDTEEEEEGQEENFLALDSSVAAKLPEDVRKRYEQQVKGIQKRERQLNEREANVQADEKGFESFKSWETALANPEIAKDAYQELGQKLSETFGWDSQPEANEEGEYVYNGVAYLSETEVRLAKEIEALKKQRDPDMEEIKAEFARRKEAEAKEAWVKSNSQAIIAKVQGKTGGWGVTKDQIAQAYEANPEGMKSKPVDTLKALNPDSYAEWYATKKAKRAVPEMIDGTDAKGLDLPKNKADWTFEDHAAALGI